MRISCLVVLISLFILVVSFGCGKTPSGGGSGSGGGSASASTFPTTSITLPASLAAQ